MEILYSLVKGGLLIVIPVILSQTSKERRIIRGVLWITFILLVFSNIYINYKTDNTSKQILDDNKELLQIVKDPNFAKNPETSSKLKNIERNISLMENKSKAILKFSFWSGKDILIDKTIAPIEKGVVTVKFSAKNISTAQANNGKIWIQICDGCKFAEEPQDSEITHDDVVRRKRFEHLYAGAYFDPTILKIIPPPGVNSFTIAFKYACETCPPIDNDHPQKLTVSY